MHSKEPLVSIYCLAYNHEQFIRDSLNGFLMQETNFDYEVIIHDDASTDNTPNIIREYEEKYPEIIKPIYQKENKYSVIGIELIPKYILPKVRGKYVAICEGDDYWTDKEKLQRQVDIMEQHPECHFCVCGVEEVSLNKSPLGYNHPNFAIYQEIIQPEDFICFASQYSFQTSSYFMRYCDWNKYLQNPPEFKLLSDIGDIAMLLYFGSMGKTAYINKIMSCYRRGALESYSTKKNNWNEQKRIMHFEKQISVWKSFDQYTQNKYHDICKRKIAGMQFGYCILRGSMSELLTKDNQEYYLTYSIAKRIFVRFACILRKQSKKVYLYTMKRRETKEKTKWGNT